MTLTFEEALVDKRSWIMEFYPFDLDLDSMTLVLKFGLDIVKIHVCTKNEVPIFSSSKDIAWIEKRWTHRLNWNYYLPAYADGNYFLQTCFILHYHDHDTMITSLDHNFDKHLRITKILKQECIPVGCVPPAAVAFRGVSTRNPPGTRTLPPGTGTLQDHTPPWDHAPPTCGQNDRQV